jgi:hypothetical protein
MFGFFCLLDPDPAAQNECGSMQIRIGVPYTGSKQNPNQDPDTGFKFKTFI